MKRLKAFLDKRGISYSETTYGANYFNDHTLDLHFEGLIVGIDCESHYQAHNIECEIRKYCHRYGYTLIQEGGFPGYHYINITTTAAAEALRNYQTYSRKSVEQCEKHIHFCHTYYGTTSPTLNEELSGIMEFYEDEYKTFLQEQTKKPPNPPRRTRARSPRAAGL